MEVSPQTQLLDDWIAICHDPRFQDFPHKVELSATGKIIMSPSSAEHFKLQVIVANLLRSVLPEGFTGSEMAVLTEDGIRAPDVVWCSADVFNQLGSSVASPRAPEICVEMMSPSNTMAEMEEKRDLYFEKGCREFILVDRKRFVTFFSPEGQLEESLMCPGFPARVEVPWPPSEASES